MAPQISQHKRTREQDTDHQDGSQIKRARTEERSLPTPPEEVTIQGLLPDQGGQPVAVPVLGHYDGSFPLGANLAAPDSIKGIDRQWRVDDLHGCFRRRRMMDDFVDAAPPEKRKRMLDARRRQMGWDEDEDEDEDGEEEEDEEEEYSDSDDEEKSESEDEELKSEEVEVKVKKEKLVE